jgi:3',5'-nucleoside bisphosphate phosphatase
VPANLHLHSNFSDGTLTPAEVVDLAASAGLGIIAITDHDTDEGVELASRAGDGRGIDVISGIEVSAMMPAREVHILGYGFEAGHPRIVRYRERLRAERERRASEMVALLQSFGIGVTYDDVLREAGGGMVGRPHIARALAATDAVADESEAFDRYLGDGRPAWVAKRGLSARNAIDLIHECGGVAVLAHPGQWTTDEEIRQLVDVGLDGLEVIHPSHQPFLAEYWMATALRYGLIRTGGSDYHGSREEEPALDDYVISDEWVDILRERIDRYSHD